MVGRRSLKAKIGVRIPVPEHFGKLSVDQLSGMLIRQL